MSTRTRSRSKTLIDVTTSVRNCTSDIVNSTLPTLLSWRHRYRNDVIHADVVEGRNAPPAEPIYDYASS